MITRNNIITGIYIGRSNPTFPPDRLQYILLRPIFKLTETLSHSNYGLFLF